MVLIFLDFPEIVSEQHVLLFGLFVGIPHLFRHSDWHGWTQYPSFGPLKKRGEVR